MSERPLTCVIGAGPSGLAACKVLSEYGVPVVCYEAGDRVGGQWVLGNRSGTSSAYRSLTTNTHKGMSRYSDFDLPEHYPDFPSADQMAAWFEAYARHFDVLGRVRLGSRVVRADRLPDGRWEVETDRGERASYEALIVSIGNLWDPVTPHLEGQLDGPVLHAKDYMDPGDPVDCRGKNVLVMGLGNTACELAVELSGPEAARRVLLSCRSGQRILPRRIGGRLMPAPHPSEPLRPPFDRLPRPLRDGLFRLVFPRILSRMLRDQPNPEDLGLPPAPRDPFEKRVVINDHLFERLRAGRIEPKPAVRRLVGTKVEFADGSSEEVDVLITATGYRLTFPFFREDLPGLGGGDIALYRGVMHPEFQNLFVIGVMKAICSIWPRAEQQMRWVAPLLAGERRAPSPREIRRETYPVLGVPFSNCQFHVDDLRRDTLRTSRGR